MDRVAGNSIWVAPQIALDKDGTDVWKQWNCPPIDTIEQALDRVDSDGGWLHFIPPEIHSE